MGRKWVCLKMLKTKAPWGDRYVFFLKINVNILVEIPHNGFLDDSVCVGKVKLPQESSVFSALFLTRAYEAVIIVKKGVSCTIFQLQIHI